MHGTFVPFWNNLLPLYIYISVGTSDSVMYIAMLIQCSSEWPRGLRREAATALFLGLRVRIPPGPWMYLSLVIVVPCQVDVSAKYTSLVRRSPTECGVSEFVLKPRQWGGLGPRSLSSQEKKNGLLNNTMILRKRINFVC